MNVYVPLGLFLTLLCLLFSNNKKGAVKMFTICMAVAFVFSALRYEFGPDYFHYWEIYEHGEQGRSLSSYLAERDDVRLEPFFRYYLQLFPKYTFFIITNTLLWFVAIFFVFKKYVDLKYSWVLILFLFFNINCLINNYVAMRTSLAAICFIPGLYFLMQNKRWLYVFFVILGSLFHTASIALVVLVFLSFKKGVLNSKVFIVVCGFLGFLIVLIGQNFITTTLSTLVMDSVEDMNRYAGYLDKVSKASFTLNALLFKVLSFIPAFYLAYASQFETEKEFIIINKVGIIASLLILLLGQNILTDRFLMILNPIFIVSIIHSLQYCRKEFNIIALSSVFIVSFYMFYNTMNSSYAISYQTYQTVFSAPFIP